MSVPSSSYYKPPIGVVSSAHGSSLMAYGSLNTTPLVERINKIKKILDGKLMLVDDDVKPLNKVDSDQVDSDSESDVEATYDETTQFMSIGVELNEYHINKYKRIRTCTYQRIHRVI
ncbi:hypothetical protein Tco_0119138 [Tanacetum coccineum]